MRSLKINKLIEEKESKHLSSIVYLIKKARIIPGFNFSLIHINDDDHDHDQTLQ